MSDQLIDQCSNCKFWQIDDEPYSEAINAKECAYVEFAPDATIWDEDNNNVLRSECAHVKAFVADASGYSARFYTKEDFSCNQHQKRDK